MVIKGATGRNQGRARMQGCCCCCCCPALSKLTPTTMRTLSPPATPPSLQQPDTSTRKGWASVIFKHYCHHHQHHHHHRHALDQNHWHWGKRVSTGQTPRTSRLQVQPATRAMRRVRSPRITVQHVTFHRIHCII